jgi:hypothetical protein
VPAPPPEAAARRRAYRRCRLRPASIRCVWWPLASLPARALGKHARSQPGPSHRIARGFRFE